MARRRRRKRKQKKGTGRGVPRILWLILGIAGLVAVFFFRDDSGVRLGLTGSYLWFVGMTAAFAAGLVYLAQFTLPLSRLLGWYEGLRLVIKLLFRPVWREINLLLLRPYAPAAVGETKSKLSSSFGILKVGFVESHNALAIVKGASFERADGPGYVQLERLETVSQVVDLRRHLRRMDVKAMTRDGIPLDTRVMVIFRVKQEEEPADPDIQYPYDGKAVFNVHYWGNLGGGSHVSWSDRIIHEAADALVAELSRYTLDDLYNLDGGGAPPVEKIKGKLKGQLSETFGRYGIRVFNVGVGAFGLPDKVIQQRINNWQSKWKRRIYVEQAAGDTEALRRIQRARARAQIEIIENIANSIEHMRRNQDADLTEIVALRMIQAMQNAVSDDTVQAMVPQHVMATLRQIRLLVEKESEQS